ncbi:MAG: hypothetical protein H6817_02890 [Phycisphaerales bacterium]|nr:hypothetical protein [Phycisphaerales bacterium]
MCGMLASGPPFAQHPALVLLIVITVGLVLGKLRVAGMSLGPSGVIFVALAGGHFGYHLPAGIGPVGLVLFIYCIGLSAGPSFFRAFRRHGKVMALLALGIVAVGALTTFGVARVFRLPPALATGIFAGAMTSTPGLAAGIEALPKDNSVGVGFGLAYPFGLICVVAFVHILPRLMRADLRKLTRDAEAFDEDARRIERVLVKVLNPAVIGRKLVDLSFIADYNCQVSRMLVGNRLEPLPAGLVLEEGQRLLIVARKFRLPPVIQLLGERDDQTGVVRDTEDQSMHVVVSDRRLVGKSLFELNLRSRFGVTVTRIMRHDLEFVPRVADRIEYGDRLLVVGEHENLERFSEFAGHNVQTFDETDLVSLGLGIAAGVALGVVEFGIGGQKLTLGLSGGPLLVALLLGHLGKVGPIKGHLPRAARLLLTEIGLTLLLADAGVSAGAALGEVLRSYGIAMCAAAVIVAVIPMVAGAIIAYRVLHVSLPQLLGGICGGMTSTPGIGAVTASAGSEAPVVSYAAAYPVALIMMTVFVRMLVAMMS